MARTAEDVLEFGRLLDLLRGRTTCAPGRRAVDALGFSTDRAALEAAFALIAEAIAFLHDGSEMGFGSLADPEPWIAAIEESGSVLAPPLLLDAVSLADTAAWLRESFRGESLAETSLAASIAEHLRAAYQHGADDANVSAQSAASGETEIIKGAVAEIAAQPTQSKVLDALLTQAAHFSQRVVLFVTTPF